MLFFFCVLYFLGLICFGLLLLLFNEELSGAFKDEIDELSYIEIIVLILLFPLVLMAMIVSAVVSSLSKLFRSK